MVTHNWTLLPVEIWSGQRGYAMVASREQDDDGDGFTLAQAETPAAAFVSRL